MAKAKAVKVRILQACHIDGVPYRADAIVEIDPALAEQQASIGHCDPHLDAVSYCIKVLGAVPVKHKAPENEEIVPAVSDEPAVAETTAVDAAAPTGRQRAGQAPPPEPDRDDAVSPSPPGESR